MSLSRDFWLVAGGRLVTALVSLVGIRVATNFLVPAQYGELAILGAIQMFCGLFLVNPVGQHINRHTHQWWDDGTLLSRLMIYRRYIVGVSIVGAVVSVGVISQQSPQQAILVAGAIMLMVIAGTWNATLIPMLNMVGFRGASVFLAITTALFGLFASVVLINWWPSATAWFWGQALGMAVGALGAGRVLRHHAQVSGHSLRPLPLLDWSTVATYCLPLALATGFMWMQLSGYRFVIKVFWGLEALGFLVVGLSIAGQIWGLVESLAQQLLYPLFYRRITKIGTNDSQSALSDLLNIVGPLYLVFVGVVLLGAPSILRLLVAPQYADADIFVRLGAAIECCRVLGNVLSNAAQVTKNTYSMTLPYAIGAITATGLIIVVALQQLGIVWVGVVLVFAAAVTLIGMVISMYRQVPFLLDIHRWLVASLAMGILGFSAFWFSSANGWIEAIGRLVLILGLGTVIMIALLWKSAALQRLLAVNLRETRGTV